MVKTKGLKAEEVYRIRCNNCWSHFVDDENLKILSEKLDSSCVDDFEFFKGCPLCETDEYLMDLEQ